MKLNPRGQSLLEYTSIVILIMLGMIIGKTVVDRGAKAGIKNLTESVEESDIELIRQGPRDPTINLPTCTCGQWQNGGCGGGICSETFMQQFRICTPQGCENEILPPIPTQQCTPDNSCCTPWELVGPPSVACGVNAIALNPPNGCPDDQGWSSRQCGNLPMEFSCQAHPTCVFRCQNLGVGALPCSPPRNENTRLGQSMNYHYLANENLCLASCPLPPNQSGCCGAYCKPGFTLSPQGICECAPGYAPDPNTGECVLVCVTGTQTPPWISTAQFGNSGTPVHWNCPANHVMTGLETRNEGDGGNNWWRIICQEVSAGCPLEGSTVSTPPFNQLQANGFWDGAVCPYGYVSIGISTVNNEPQGGHNDWWLRCRKIKPACVALDYWQTGWFMGSFMQTDINPPGVWHFYEDTESQYVGHNAPACRYVTAVFTKRRFNEQGGHNDWLIGGGSCGGPGSGIPVNQEIYLGEAQINSRSGRIASGSGSAKCISSSQGDIGGGAWMTTAKMKEWDYGGNCNLGDGNCPPGGQEGYCCTIWVPGFAYAPSHSALSCFDAPNSHGVVSNYPLLRDIGAHGNGNGCHPGTWLGQCKAPGNCNIPLGTCSPSQNPYVPGVPPELSPLWTGDSCLWNDI